MTTPNSYLDQYLARKLVESKRNSEPSKRMEIAKSHSESMIVKLHPSSLSKSLLSVSIPPKLIVRKSSKKTEMTSKKKPGGVEKDEDDKKNEVDLLSKEFTKQKDHSKKDEDHTSKEREMNKSHSKTAHKKVDLEIYDQYVNLDLGTKQHKAEDMNEALVADVRSVQDEYKHVETREILDRGDKAIRNNANSLFNNTVDADKGKGIQYFSVKTTEMSKMINERSMSYPSETIANERKTILQRTRENSFAQEEEARNLDSRLQNTGGISGRLSKEWEDRRKTEQKQNLDSCYHFGRDNSNLSRGREKSIDSENISRLENSSLRDKNQVGKYPEENCNQEKNPERTSDKEETFDVKEETNIGRTEKRFPEKEGEISYQYKKENKEETHQEKDATCIPDKIGAFDERTQKERSHQVEEELTSRLKTSPTNKSSQRDKQHLQKEVVRKTLNQEEQETSQLKSKERTCDGRPHQEEVSDKISGEEATSSQQMKSDKRNHREGTFYQDSESRRFYQEESPKNNPMTELGKKQSEYKSSRSDSSKDCESTPEKKAQSRFKDTKQAWPTTTSETATKKQKGLSQKLLRSVSRLKHKVEAEETNHGKTPNYLQNTLHGKEFQKDSSKFNNANATQSESDLHCNSQASPRNRNSNQSHGINFSESYSIRLLRKERNIGAKLHRELERKKEIGKPKLVLLFGKKDEDGTDAREETARESTASRLTSKIRSRRNSVVEFFQRKLTSDKSASKNQSSTQKCKETQEENENQENSRKSTEVESTDRCRGESPTSWEDPLVDSKPDIHDINKEVLAPITEVNIVKTMYPSKEENMENINSEDVTYNMPTIVKRKIDELKALKRRKRIEKHALMALEVTGESLNNEDISAEKTYKKIAPGMRKLTRKIAPTAKTTESKKELSTIPQSKMNKYTSSNYDYKTADTHSSRIASGRSLHTRQPMRICNSSQTTFSRPISSMTMPRETTPLYPSVMDELEGRTKVVWTDEKGNLCEVENEGGKYGSISYKTYNCLEKNVVNLNPCWGTGEGSRGINKWENRVNNVITPNPLSPESIRKRREAMAKAWEGLPSTSGRGQSPKCDKPLVNQTQSFLFYTDGFETSVKVPALYGKNTTQNG